MQTGNRNFEQEEGMTRAYLIGLIGLSVLLASNAPATVMLAGYWNTSLDSSHGGNAFIGALPDGRPAQLDLFFGGHPLGLALRDQGTNGDLVAGDGIYSLSLPFGPGELFPSRFLLEISDGGFGNWPYLNVRDSLPANIITVGHGGGYDFNSITNALNAAGPKDIVLLAADTNYTALTGEVFPLRVPDGVILRSADVARAAHIIGDGSNPVLIADGGGVNGVSLEGLWLSRGAGLSLQPEGFDVSATFGGGFLIIDTNATLYNSRIDACTADYGGGIAVIGGGKTYVESSDVRGNSANLSGGGIFTSGAVNTTLSNTFVRENNAVTSGGGAFFSVAGRPYVVGCWINNNTARNGAGLLFWQTDGAVVTRTTVSYNIADGWGAGVLCDATSPELTHLTISENYAGYGGGGLYCGTGAAPVLTNCLLWGNTDDLFEEEDSLATLSHCLVGDGDRDGIDGNFSAPPLFQDSATADFRLLNGSPAIDRGLDLGWGHEGAAPDIGSIESSYSGPFSLPVPRTVTISPGHGLGGLEIIRELPPGSTIILAPGEYRALVDE
jgi:hypothetical protein